MDVCQLAYTDVYCSALSYACQHHSSFSHRITSLLAEDVGVTAYKGAAPLLTSAAILEAAAGEWIAEL